MSTPISDLIPEQLPETLRRHLTTTMTSTSNRPDSEAERCTRCGESGYNPRWTRAADGIEYRTRFCSCEAGVAARQEEADRRAAANRRAQQQLYDAAGIPSQFRDLTVQSLRDRCAEESGDDGKSAAIEAAVAYVQGDLGSIQQDRPGLLVHGWYGVGKTGLLTAVYKELIRRGAQGLWIECYDLLDAVQDYDSGQSRERLQRAQEVELLMLDDLGTTRRLVREGKDRRRWRSRPETDDKQLILDKLISYRHRHQRPTLITTNLTLNQLGQQLDQRIVERIMQLCHCVEMAGTNFRQQMRTNE